MKVAIATVQVPFITGGAEILADSLKKELLKRKVEAEIIALPFKWYPATRLLDCMTMARLADLTEVNGVRIDRVIAMKFPAYFIPHPNKVGWIMHQHRQAYDLYETPHGDLHGDAAGQEVAEEIFRWDSALLPREMKRIYTLSNVVTDRLARFNGVSSTALYHPPGDQERFRCDEYGDFILCPGRLDSLKRQHLAVEAMLQAPRGLKLILIGHTETPYGGELRAAVKKFKLQDQVEILGPVSLEKKIDLYAKCLGVYNGVLDEDYGYVTLEAFLARKPVIIHPDAGGPLEFVAHQENGWVVPAEPSAIARVFGALFSDRALARSLGEAGQESYRRKRVSWENVIERLLA